MSRRAEKRREEETARLARVIMQITAAEGGGKPAARPRIKPSAAAVPELQPLVWDGVGYRNRRQLQPVLVGLGLLGAAGFFRAAVRIGGMPARPVTVFAAVVAVLVALASVAGQLRRKSNGVPAVPVGKRWRVILAAMLGVVWLVWTVHAGVTIRAVLALAALDIAASAYWLRAIRLPTPDGPPTETPKVQLDSGTFVQRWNANVAPAGGLFPGTKIMDAATTGHTEAYTIKLPRGSRIHLGTVVAGLPSLGVALGKPMVDLLVEDHPDIEDPAFIRFQVVTRSPIKETVYFDEPRWVDGRILLGPYADGDGDAFYRLYTKNRIRNGFAIGTTGSGKSRLLEAISVTARAMGNTVIIYIDGQDGASSSVLAEQALWSGGPDEVADMVTGLEGMFRRRMKINKAEKRNGFTPSPEWPGILVIIDECHLVLNAKTHPKIAERLDPMARGGNKVGMGFLLASQDSGLGVFGGLDSLRGAVMANKIGMRVESNIAPQLIPGLDLDLRTLPELPGYLYTVASKLIGGRTAPGRVRYLPDADDIADDPSIPVPTVEQWMGTYPGIDLDGRTAAGAGDVFLKRHERAARRMEQLLLEVGGDTPEPPTPALPDGPDGLPVQPAAVGPVLTPAQQTVYDAIRAGAGRWQDVADTTGLQERSIRNHVKGLVQAGLVSNRRNSYTLSHEPTGVQS